MVYSDTLFALLDPKESNPVDSSLVIAVVIWNDSIIKHILQKSHWLVCLVHCSTILLEPAVSNLHIGELAD